MAAASLRSFLPRLTNGLTYCGGISRTWWPSAVSTRPPVVRTPARFEHDLGRRLLGKKAFHLAAAEVTAQHSPLGLVYAVQSENVLGRVDRNAFKLPWRAAPCLTVANDQTLALDAVGPSTPTNPPSLLGAKRLKRRVSYKDGGFGGAGTAPPIFFYALMVPHAPLALADSPPHRHPLGRPLRLALRRPSLSRIRPHARLAAEWRFAPDCPAGSTVIPASPWRRLAAAWWPMTGSPASFPGGTPIMGSVCRSPAKCSRQRFSCRSFC